MVRSFSLCFILQLFHAEPCGRIISSHLPGQVSLLLIFETVLHLIFQTNFVRFPYNWKSPTAYFFSIFLQTFEYTIASSISYLILSIFVSFCKIAVAFVHDQEENINDLRMEIKCLPKKLSITKRIILMKRLRYIMQFQMDARQYVTHFL